MLIAFRQSATAARRRRTHPAFASLIALAALSWGGCSSPHSDPHEWDGVRDALIRAVRELRPVNPAAADEIERLVAEAEIASAAERNAPAWSRKSGWGAAAWSRAAETARRLLAEQRLIRGQQADRLDRLLDGAELSIAAGAARIGRSGASGRSAGEVAAGRTHIATARKLAEHGDYAAALDHANRALALAVELDAAWSRDHERFSDPALLALWRGLADATIEESRRSATAAIVVDKMHRTVSLYRAGRRIARFDAELGANGLERKLYSGDRATPEGRYRVAVKKSGGATKYHLALLIDYPNADDRRRYQLSVEEGVIPRSTGIGGLIEIHGGGGTGRDWTDGCVALSDDDMDRLFPEVRVGTPVTIVGTL